MKITIYTIAAMALGAFTACQSEPDNGGYTNDPDAVRINATIGSLQSRVNSSESGDKWTAGDAIHVSNVTEGAVAGKDEAIYTYSTDNGFVPGDKYVVWIAGKENRFHAYYPYVDGVEASYDGFPLPLDQSGNTPGQEGYIGYADWMTATVPSASQTVDKSISLWFKHQLARVTVKITGYNNQYGSTLPVVSDPVFSVPGEYRDARVTVDPDAKVKGFMLADESASKLHSFMAILPAGQYAADATLMTLNVDGQTLTVRPSSYLVNTVLECGRAYTVNLIVGKNTASISGITVTDWNDGWNENGTAVEERIKVEGSVITTTEPGLLTSDLLDKATSEGTELTIKGSELNKDDFKVLSGWLVEKYNEDATREFSLILEDVTELPNAAFSSENPIDNLSTLKAPNVEKMSYASFFQIKIGELWLTKAGAMEVSKSWYFDYSGYSTATTYLNADKRIGGTGLPTVEVFEDVAGYAYWQYSWADVYTKDKNLWRFVDEAGNITDWDGNPVATE